MEHNSKILALQSRFSIGPENREDAGGHYDWKLQPVHAKIQSFKVGNLIIFYTFYLESKESNI